MARHFEFWAPMARKFWIRNPKVARPLGFFSVFTGTGSRTTAVLDIFESRVIDWRWVLKQEKAARINAENCGLIGCAEGRSLYKDNRFALSVR